MVHKDEKNIAILGYASALFLYVHMIPFIAVLGVAILWNAGKGHEFASFHLRQMVGIAVIAILINGLTNIVPNVFIALLLITFMVVLAVLGLVSALKEQKDELPYIGSYFQDFFKFIK